MLATGGGESNPSTGAVTLHETHAKGDGSGWEVKVTNDGDTDSTFRVYTVCFSGLSSYQQITRSTVIESGIVSFAQAPCTSGQQLLGGGGWADTLDTAIDTTPAVSPGYEAWNFGAAEPRSGTRTFTSQAVCGTGINNHQVQSALSPQVSPGTEVSTIVYCPGGTWSVGGGGSGNAPAGMRLTDSFPDTDTGDSWRVWAHNDGPDSMGLYALTICGN